MDTGTKTRAAQKFLKATSALGECEDAQERASALQKATDTLVEDIAAHTFAVKDARLAAIEQSRKILSTSEYLFVDNMIRQACAPIRFN